MTHRPRIFHLESTGRKTGQDTEGEQRLSQLASLADLNTVQEKALRPFQGCPWPFPVAPTHRQRGGFQQPGSWKPMTITLLSIQLPERFFGSTTLCLEAPFAVLHSWEADNTGRTCQKGLIASARQAPPAEIRCCLWDAPANSDTGSGTCSLVPV